MLQLQLISLPVCVCQLTVGLYEFGVTVDGEGAHGEGYVNVTVKPGETNAGKLPSSPDDDALTEDSLPQMMKSDEQTVFSARNLKLYKTMKRSLFSGL